MTNELIFSLIWITVLLIVSAFMGSIIGVAREGKTTAGMGTHGIVSLSSTAVMIAVFNLDSSIGDFWRVPAAIIGGIGFIGAGVMWKDEDGVKHGLTTAATILATSIVGILVGLSLDASFYTYDDEFKYINVRGLYLAIIYPTLIFAIFLIRNLRRAKVIKLEEEIAKRKIRDPKSKKIISLKEKERQLKRKLEKIKEDKVVAIEETIKEKEKKK